MREDKVQESPEFWKVILQWCAREDESMSRGIELGERLRKFGVSILHSVPFIDDHMGPPPFAENRAILDDIFVGSEQNVERIAQLELKVSPHLRRAFVRDYSEGGCPFRKL